MASFRIPAPWFCTDSDKGLGGKNIIGSSVKCYRKEGRGLDSGFSVKVKIDELLILKLQKALHPLDAVSLRLNGGIVDRETEETDGTVCAVVDFLQQPLCHGQDAVFIQEGVLHGEGTGNLCEVGEFHLECQSMSHEITLGNASHQFPRGMIHTLPTYGSTPSPQDGCRCPSQSHNRPFPSYQRPLSDAAMTPPANPRL